MQIPIGRTESEALQRNLRGGEEGAQRDPEAYDRLHDGALRQIHAERHLAPIEYQELKHRTRAPKSARRDGERNLPEAVPSRGACSSP